MTIKSNSSRSFPYLSSCCSKDPVNKDAIIKVSKDAGKRQPQEASSAPDLQPAYRSSRRNFPARLQKLYAETKCCSKDTAINGAIIKVSKDAGKSRAQKASSSAHDVNQGSLAASPSSVISRGTNEIQEERESHFIAASASTSRDGGAPSLPRPEQPITLADLPKCREEESLSITNDVALQRHPEHGVAAVLQRDSQNASAADRGRHALLNITEVGSSWRKATKTLVNVYGAAASSFRYSAAAFGNPSPYQMSMASGVSWAATCALSGINHALFSQKRDVVSLLSDAANFGAGVASMATTDLTYRSNPNQTNVNYAATSSNILRAASSTTAS
jgi:hypothetical protein